MKHFIAVLLVFSGWGLAIFSSVVGLSFSGVFLTGFVGTGGREAGGELAGMLLLTIAGIIAGYAIAKSGKWLDRRNGLNT